MFRLIVSLIEIDKFITKYELQRKFSNKKFLIKLSCSSKFNLAYHFEF